MSEYSSYRYETEPEVSTEAVAETSGVFDMLPPDRDGLAGNLVIRSLKSMGERVKDRMQKLEEMGKSPAMARLESLQAAPLLEAAVLTELSKTPDLLVFRREPLLDRLQKFESPQLDRLIHQGNNRLILGQTRVIHTRVKAALTDLGYDIRPSKRPLPDSVVVQGVRSADNTSISICLTPKEEKLETDLSGFKDEACTRVLAALEDRLRRRGVKLNLEQRESHGCAGGHLTRTINAVLEEQAGKDGAKDKKSIKKTTLTARNKVRN